MGGNLMGKKKNSASIGFDWNCLIDLFCTRCSSCDFKYYSFFSRKVNITERNINQTKKIKWFKWKENYTSVATGLSPYFSTWEAQWHLRVESFKQSSHIYKQPTSTSRWMVMEGSQIDQNQSLQSSSSQAASLKFFSPRIIHFPGAAPS